MDKGTLILLVDESTAGIDSIRRVLADRAHHFRVQRVDDVPTALARILGGGVDIVLLNLPAAAGPQSERLLPFLELRNQAQAVPIVVLCGASDGSLAEAAIREGAADYLIREAYALDLLRVLRSVSAKTGVAAPRRSAAAPARRESPGLHGLQGRRRRHHRRAQRWLRPSPKTIASFWVTSIPKSELWHSTSSRIVPVPDLGDLLRSESGLESCLWPSKTVPGLQVLFGSRNLDAPLELTPANIPFALAALTEAADYVVADIPTTLADSNRAVIEDAALLVLVVERDSLAVDSARLLLRAIDYLEGRPGLARSRSSESRRAGLAHAVNRYRSPVRHPHSGSDATRRGSVRCRPKCSQPAADIRAR